MSETLTYRLNQILPTVTADEFLQGRGLGNEIGFFIFDYPPAAELEVRSHIQSLLVSLPKQKPGLRVRHINLFELVLAHLKERNLLGKALDMESLKGSAELRKALAGPLHEDKLAKVFAQAVPPQETDLVLVSGIGSVWPLLRTHTLLNNLHSLLANTPLVLFYPGYYDNQSLRLFGKITNDNYYRAFKLVP